jgi:sugar phosphate isomerase/epimerase
MITSAPRVTIVRMTVQALRPAHQVEQLLSLNVGLVGASTGFLSDLREDWPAMIEASIAVSDQVIELSALSGDELHGLTGYLRTDDVTGWPHVSVHGPAKRWASTPHALADALAALPASIDGIVMHPETLRDPTTFESLSARLWLENMDTRKADARTVDELARYFELLPDAGFCFDIAHAWLHDPTMGLAHALLDAFDERLAEVHLSSILPSGRHVPLRPSSLAVFEPILARCVGVPWILEAPLPA